MGGALSIGPEAPEARHGGNRARLAREAGIDVGQIVDFSASINPLGPPEWLRPVLSGAVSELAHYPDPDSSALVEAIAERYGVPQAEVVVAGGSSEIISWLPVVLAPDRVVVAVPTYLEYARAAALAGVAVQPVPLREEDDWRLDTEALDRVIGRGDLVFLGHPNNPTGRPLEADGLRWLADRHPSATFVVDEAFADFVEGIDRLVARRPSNVLALCSLTKFHAIPGLRLGFAAAQPAFAERLRRRLPPWSVNTLAQVVGVEMVRDVTYHLRSRAFTREARERLVESLRAIPGVRSFPSEANFLLVRLSGAWPDAPSLARRLLSEGLAIRTCEGFEGLGERFFRVAVRTAEDNQRLCAALERACPHPQVAPVRCPAVLDGASSTAVGPSLEQVSTRRTRHRRPSLMVAGTGSNAGKSILAAALCRILLQDGYRVAPFKSQNMSLNSFVTREGGEMGRAQVVQAQACRLDPDVRMNPILLKPNSETGSQVIVRGRPVGNMDVRAYIRFKPEAFGAACDAFDSLSSEHDVIVLEGAGSVAEVNLKSHDIVNLAMARYAGAPVLLVGDIDRGGVFASFVGTMEVLAEWERALIAGFVVNRFRGRRDLLDDALAYTRRHTGRPVLGVVPYLRHLGLPEEDSVSFKERRSGGCGRQGAVRIAVVDFPHVSNFTDFDALEGEPDVDLLIARSPADLEGADAVILPGSKSVASDLAWLLQSGLGDRLRAMAESDACEIVGICGGLQVLGDTIADPHGIESAGTTARALGILPVSTDLAPAKTLRAVRAVHSPSGSLLRGYEIHHGRTEGTGLAPAVVRDDGEVIGFSHDTRRAWGTYLHGLFDADGFRRHFVDRLRAARGWDALGDTGTRYDLEPALDRLADVVRESLDLGAIYRSMGLR